MSFCGPKVTCARYRSIDLKCRSPATSGNGATEWAGPIARALISEAASIIRGYARLTRPIVGLEAVVVGTIRTIARVAPVNVGRVRVRIGRTWWRRNRSADDQSCSKCCKWIPPTVTMPVIAISIVAITPVAIVIT
ncbi:hypothetical protein EV130_11565 [Rhizobium azibense]|uniref:Uncharacterized protein n=1 Tax=Rhizobium azibense TaxID=1136135 RepID=A0A4R3Q916_9HYPH|nr:hypothetical protein EV130_11565 [Rhizobium azibense]